MLLFLDIFIERISGTVNAISNKFYMYMYEVQGQWQKTLKKSFMSNHIPWAFIANLSLILKQKSFVIQ